MQDFRGKLAVVTGGGTGIGRELALQLARAGASVAICDVFEDNLLQAKAACEAEATGGARISATRCDVASEAQVLAFRDAVLRDHGTDHVDLLFNNAGVGGGGSFVKDTRESWERTFNICWYGVYFCTRAFLPLLIASKQACIVNTSSINGIYAYETNGPHTAYASAKFAVKGFSEALITDLRLNAPHVKVVLVMPGHIGTSIVANTLRTQGMREPKDMSAQEVAGLRVWLSARNVPHESMSDEQVRQLAQSRFDAFRDKAPVSAAQAAAEMLAAVQEGRWRVLIGEDAKLIEARARKNPEDLYEPATIEEIRAAVLALRKA